MASCQENKKGFYNYPEAKKGPDTPYTNNRKENPAVRGWSIYASALLLENFPFIRRKVWCNSGFGDLRKIRADVEYCEPRYDPTVVPTSALRSPFESKNDPASDSGDTLTPRTLSSHGYYSVTDYTAMYLSGELTPLAVARALLPLIRKDTSPPGQYSIGWFDSNVAAIMTAAEASTLRYQKKTPLGPLDGVPTAVKDEYDIEGYTTSLGSLNDYTTDSKPGESITAWCVKKMDEAGAINLGKLHMHEFGLDTSGNNPIKGTPPNPYNPKYYTGGSSSGCGYAVACGLIPIALGGDGGGSIRIPASFCSVFGLKPSHGRLSFKPCMNHSSSCAVNGPIAADIASLTTFYQVIGAQDSTSLFPAPSPTILSPSLRKAKVLGIPETWFARSTPAIQRLCRSLIDKMVTLHDYTIVPITIPFLSEGQIAHAMTVLTDAATLLPMTSNLTSANRIMIAIGTVTPSVDYVLAQKLRQLLMQHLAYLWQQHPGMVIITPTTSCAGWKIGRKDDLKYGISDGNQTLKTMEYVWMANFLGLPALTMPVGHVKPEGSKGEGEEADEVTVGKVPVGMMAMGEWGAEEDLLRLGLDAEVLGNERRRRPPIWIDVVKMAREEMESS
ncbi:probable amidases [Rhynchosporium secalis]|uniref:Probable amidases n=1 Tax=Rhynchosporium secalis TaxID=38038 RepID=A0A1E1LX49_RHYSE|nr:probable amidases [Rhynchosporium secalis]